MKKSWGIKGGKVEESEEKVRESEEKVRLR